MLSTQSIKSTYSREVGDMSAEKKGTARPFATPGWQIPFRSFPTPRNFPSATGTVLHIKHLGSGVQMPALDSHKKIYQTASHRVGFNSNFRRARDVGG